MSLFTAYKPEQARLSRTTTLLSGLFLIAWGSHSLLRMLSDPGIWGRGWKGGLALNQIWGDATEADAWTVDLVVFKDNLSPAFLVASLLFVVLALSYWRFLNRPRWADLLIDMEQELRKVSWPTASDAWQSTLVVTGFTATVVVTILVYDVVIKGFITLFVNT